MIIRWKALGIFVVLAVAIFYTIPTYQAYFGGGDPQEIQKKVNLGLDLQGGMYMDIEVKTEEAVAEVIRRTAQELEDLLIDNYVDFLQVEILGSQQVAVHLAPKEKVKFDESPYERFLIQYKETREGQRSVFTLNEEEIKRIRENSVKQALEVLRNRIDGLGVSEPSIQVHGENSILIQLPGLKDREQAIKLIGPQAVLEFYLVDDNVSAYNYNPKTHVVKYEEERDKITKEVTKRYPHVLEKKVLLTGEYIRDAVVRFSSQDNQPYVGLSFDGIGTERFGRITKNNVGKRLAIVLDNKVQSAPVIREEITGGEASISGIFSMEEASNLAIVLRSGSLPAPIEIREERTVGASLGEDSVNQGLMSLLIGGCAVLIFMILYYRTSGTFACIAVLFNIILIVSVLAAFEATLTLPGMAGIVLTLGMSVDANVLIFERIREELKREGYPRKAINEGFGKAFWTIFDANITTLFGALALLQFGTGPIKGFAVTLSIGIIASMFTAIVVTKFMFDLVYLRRAKLKSISI